MKKLVLILTLTLVFSSLALYISAEENSDKPDKKMSCPMMQQKMEKDAKGMEGMGMMDGCKMCPMMQQGGMSSDMKGMDHKQMMGGMMGKDSMQPMMGKPYGMISCFEHLDLSKEQKDKITDILTSHKKDMERKKSDRKTAEAELQELIAKDGTGFDLISEKVWNIAKIDADIRLSQVRAWMDARSVLNDEQKATFKKICPGGNCMMAMEMESDILIDNPEPGSSNKPIIEPMTKTESHEAHH